MCHSFTTQRLAGVAASLDPSRPYVDSSPSNGLLSQSPLLRRWGDPQDANYGDVHFYNYTCVRADRAEVVFACACA